MTIKKILLAFSIAVSSVCFAQNNVSVYTPGVTAEGLTYYLPKTMIRATITASKTTYTPGELCRYAERYLRLTDISNTMDEHWEIDNIGIQTFGIPDPECLYTISLHNISKRPDVELTKDGILSAINTHNPTESQPIASFSAAKDNINSSNPQDYLTEEILQAGSISKMAELTAKEIYSIREGRNNITRGMAENLPTDGESLKYVLEQLDIQEKALLKMFIGETTKETRIFTIDINPNGKETAQVLFRFSKKLGVLSSEDLTGSPIMVEIHNQNSLPAVEAIADNQKGVRNKSSNGKTNSSLYYRIPGRASIKVFNNQNTYSENTIPVAQFGNIETLSSTLFSKGANPKILFDTETGNVLNIEN